MHIKVKSIIITLLFLFVAYTPAHAIVYLNLNAEEGTVGATVPNPPFCQTECSGSGAKATYQSSGGTPQGSKYYQWQTVDSQKEHYTEIFPPNGSITNIMGKTFYLAWFFRYDRINGLDIWHEGSGIQSASKDLYLWGSYLRWGFLYGQWESHAPNQDHRYSLYIIDSNTYNLNPEIKVVDTYVQNQNGYSATNPIQLQYEQWYSAVFAVKIASDKTGSFTLYIDGVKVYEINNIQTVANASPDIGLIVPGGTIAQPAYDAPAYISKWDAYLLTDNWQDILNGGYLSGGGNAPPTVTLSANTTSGNAPLSVNFTANASDSDGTITQYEWDLDGNGAYEATNTNSTRSYTYNSVGTYNASVRVTDNGSATATSAVTITVSSSSSGGGSGSGGDSGGGSSGGSGCGFVKDDGKGPKAKGEGLSFAIKLIITLSFFVLAERYKHMFLFIKKYNQWRSYDKDTDLDGRRADKEIKKNRF